MFIASTVSSSVVERLGRLLITVCTGMSLVRIQPDPQHTDVFISTRSDATLITVLSLGATTNAKGCVGYEDQERWTNKRSVRTAGTLLLTHWLRRRH